MNHDPTLARRSGDHDGGPLPPVFSNLSAVALAEADPQCDIDRPLPPRAACGKIVRLHPPGERGAG